MTHLLLKLQLIFWPFVRLVLVTTAGYAGLWAALTWAAGTALGVQLAFSLEVEFWVFGLLGAGAALLGLRPRLYLLRETQTQRRDNWRMPFYLLVTVTIGAAASFAAAAVQAAMLRPVRLRDVSEVLRYPANAAYLPQRVYLAQHRTTFEEIHGSGKSGASLVIYAATPVFRAAADTAEGAALAWVGAVFRSRERHRLPAGEDFDGFLNFRQRTAAAVRDPTAANFAYLVRRNQSAELLAAVRRSPWAARLRARPVLLEARYQPFAQRATADLRALWLTLRLGTGLFLALLLFPKLSARHVRHYQETGRFSADNELWDAAVGWARPRPGFYATPLLLSLHVLVLLAMLVGGLGIVEVSAADLVAWGAGYGPVVRAGQAWRLLTSPLLSDGILPFLNNAWALVWAGKVLEPIVGPRWVAGVYGAAALAGGVASAWCQPAGFAVGAGGGIMGLFGLGVALASPARTGGPVFRLEVFGILAGAYVVASVLLGLATDRLDVALLAGGALAGGLPGLRFRQNPGA